MSGGGASIGGDHLRDEHLAVVHELHLQRGQPRARDAQLRADARQQVALDGEARFERRQARLQVFDGAFEAGDLVAVRVDARAHLAFARLRRGDLAFQRAGASSRRPTEPIAMLAPAAIASAPASVCSARRRRRARRSRRLATRVGRGRGVDMDRPS